MKGVKDPAALKGRRIGVTAPGSHSHVMANFVMARAGVKPNEYSAIGIGSGAGAVAAVRSGQVDAFVGLDPVVTQLEEADAIDIVVDTRRVEEGDALYNGPMVAGCLYAPQTFIDRNPETVQRMTNAVIRSLKTIAAITPEELMKSVPKAPSSAIRSSTPNASCAIARPCRLTAGSRRGALRPPPKRSHR